MDIEQTLKFSHVTIEQAEDGIVWIDIATEKIIRSNPAARRLLGYAEDEMRQMKVSDFDLEQSPKSIWPKHRQKGEYLSYTFESLFKRKDGTTFPSEITSNLIMFEKREYSCSVFRDISERKRAEAELEALKNRLQAENVYLQEEISHNFDEIIGHGPAIKKVLRQIEQVAPTDANVLILGETGTGKELVARAVHKLSSRSERPLVKVNCAALPASLIESELFGHERGAFTGALMRKIGRFELADQGTIFLDEIGDLPLDLQAKLLRVLQEGEFERLGSSQTRRVDVRLIAATNRRLDRLVIDKNFREDLYYRLNVFPVTCPPLKERSVDVPYLVWHFVNKANAKLGKNISRIPQSVMNILTAYHWPGNVRELENIIERGVIISAGESLQLGDWFHREAAEMTAALTLEEIERRHISAVLESTSWRVSGEKGAAKILGLKPTTLEARMKKLGLQRPR